MKLEITNQEAETILLAWAEKQFPGQFSEVEQYSRYGSHEGYLFTREEPKAEIKEAA